MNKETTTIRQQPFTAKKLYENDGAFSGILYEFTPTEEFNIDKALWFLNYLIDMAECYRYFKYEPLYEKLSEIEGKITIKIEKAKRGYLTINDKEYEDKI